MGLAALAFSQSEKLDPQFSPHSPPHSAAWPGQARHLPPPQLQPLPLLHPVVSPLHPPPQPQLQRLLPHRTPLAPPLQFFPAAPRWTQACPTSPGEARRWTQVGRAVTRRTTATRSRSGPTTLATPPSPPSPLHLPLSPGENHDGKSNSTRTSCSFRR